MTDNPNRIHPAMAELYGVDGPGPPEGTSRQEPVDLPVVTDFTINGDHATFKLDMNGATLVWEFDLPEGIRFGMGHQLLTALQAAQSERYIEAKATTALVAGLLGVDLYAI